MRSALRLAFVAGAAGAWLVLVVFVGRASGVDLL